MPLSDEDHKLSMRLAPRSKVERGDLRALLIHRLSDTLKAVLRRPLRTNAHRFGIHCEPCNQWLYAVTVPDVFVCENCQRHYRMELVIYEEIDPPTS